MYMDVSVLYRYSVAHGMLCQKLNQFSVVLFVMTLETAAYSSFWCPGVHQTLDEMESSIDYKP
jgi:hypothetical protein